MIRETALVHPNGTTYDLRMARRRDGVYTVVATLHGTNAALCGWADRRDDADRMYAVFAEWVLAGDIELIPTPRWRLVLGTVWHAITFRSTDTETLGFALRERGFPNIQHGPLSER